MCNTKDKKCSDKTAGLQTEEISLFTGVTLIYWSASSSQSAPHASIHHPLFESEYSNQTMQISYCHSGGLAVVGCGERIELSPGDFSLHPLSVDLPLPQFFPLEGSCGLVIIVDIKKTAADSSAILAQLYPYSGGMIERLCPDDTPAYFPKDPQTADIFEDFYNQTGEMRLPYIKLRCLELLLYLNSLQSAPRPEASSCQPELCDIVRKIHDRLTAQMSERITIEDLAKQYLINPTTLKTAFKAVYGTSIAAHIREHRMEEAAKMLRETRLSICEIARIVGYDSQSKFAAAFKGYYGVLPREYRRG